MKRLRCCPILLLFGCLLSGVYGAAHDQISYTVSPEYFHRFKFHQFAIDPMFHNRLGAGIVGFLASWWMGLLIGVPVLGVGLCLPELRLMIVTCLKAFVIVAVVALAVALGGLLFAFRTIDAENLPVFMMRFPLVQDTANFARVGVMHNFSYLGGFIGMVVACIYIGLKRYWYIPNIERAT